MSKKSNESSKVDVKNGSSHQANSNEYGQIVSLLLNKGHLNDNKINYALRIQSKLDSRKLLLDVLKELKYINDDQFMLTYGDGIANIDIDNLIEFHRSHGKLGTVTGINPASRFGKLKIKGNQVESFSEKPKNGNKQPKK